MNKTELKTKIGSVLVENHEGLITAADVSGLLTDVLDCTEIGGSQAMIKGSSLWAGSLQIYNGSIQHQNNLDIIVDAGTVMKISSGSVTISKDLTVNSNNVNFESLSGSVTCRNLNVKNDIKATGSIKAREVYLNGTGSSGGVLTCNKVELIVENAGFPVPIKSIYNTNVPNGIRINNGSIVYGSTGIQDLTKSNYIDFASGSINLSTGNFTCLKITGINGKSINIQSGEIYDTSHSRVISMSTKSGRIDGFDSIELGTDSTTMTLNKNGIISGATGKYIDLANGILSGFTVNATIPNDITVQSITGVKTISGDNLIIDNLYSICGNSDDEILLDATYVGCTSNFTVDGKLRVREIVNPNEGVDNININDNVNFNKNVNLAMNSVIEFATGDGGGIINNVKEITNDRDIDIKTTGSVISLKAYAVHINNANFKRVSESSTLSDIKSINTIMSDEEIYGDIKIDFPNRVITGFTTINDITNLSLSTIDHGSINVGSGAINVGNGSINVTVGSINMTNGSLNMNNATINTNANINISGAGKLIIGTISIGEVELQTLLENAGIPLS